MGNSSPPAGYGTVTPYLSVNDANAALDYYRRAFDASEVMRLDGPGGKIVHAEMQIGTSTVMLADEFPEWGNASPRTLGGSPCSLMVYVDDVDAVFARAIDEGATEEMPVQDQFYGDRSGSLVDPFGHKWMIATQKETLTGEEIGRRYQEWLREQGAAV